MKIISKVPPEYVWEADTWYNEREKKEYYPDIEQMVWKREGEKDIPFPKKCRILRKKS